MQILRGTDPFSLFQEWLQDAADTEMNDHNAMALATSTPDGQPSVRMVLLKNVDEMGFCFYTNMESKKGGELEQNPKAALCFHWKSLLRQVRVEGVVEKLPDAMAVEYFNSRHPQSRLGAWASAQSRPLSSREELLERVAAFEQKFSDGAIPKPPYWGGYRVVPSKIEFWQQGEARLHDRFLFTRQDDVWDLTRLNP